MINLQEVLSKKLAEYKEFAIEMRTDSCIRMRDPKLECDRCIQGCPFQAIGFVETLTVNSGLCTNCGLCTSVCPSSVFSHKRHTDVRILRDLRYRLIDRKEVRYSCTDGEDRPPDYSRGAHLFLPCLSMLHPSHMVNAALAGMEFFWLDQTRCDGCRISRGKEVIRQNVDQANRLFRLLRIPSAAVYSKNPPEVEQQKAKEEVETWQEKVRKVFTKEVSRRSLISGWFRRTAAPVTEPEDDGEFWDGPRYYREYEATSKFPVKRQILVDGVKRAKDFETTVTVPRADVPFGGIRITENCNLCNACVDLCPGKAIRRVDGKGKSRLEFRMITCYDCDHCEEMCPQQAIVRPGELDLGTLLELKGKTVFEKETQPCGQCGRLFISVKKNKSVCPECETSGTASPPVS